MKYEFVVLPYKCYLFDCWYFNAYFLRLWRPITYFYFLFGLLSKFFIALRRSVLPILVLI